LNHPNACVLADDADPYERNPFVVAHAGVPFYREPSESLAPQSIPTEIRRADTSIVQIPGRFVATPAQAGLTRYHQLMRELESMRFVGPERTPTPEPSARFASAPAGLNYIQCKKWKSLLLCSLFVEAPVFLHFSYCLRDQLY
jgi:hypothetical protein